jgi:3-oxoacyl-[acyl-carrier protein] reductase
MDLQLSDKIVLITGGSKGLGRAMAERFASEGCHLHLVARTPTTLDEAANELRRQYPIKINTLAIDLAQRGAAQRVAQACGDVDVLVNNAGDVLRARWKRWTKTAGAPAGIPRCSTTSISAANISLA